MFCWETVFVSSLSYIAKSSLILQTSFLCLVISFSISSVRSPPVSILGSLASPCDLSRRAASTCSSPTLHRRCFPTEHTHQTLGTRSLGAQPVAQSLFPGVQTHNLFMGQVLFNEQHCVGLPCLAVPEGSVLPLPLVGPQKGWGWSCHLPPPALQAAPAGCQVNASHTLLLLEQVVEVAAAPKGLSG